MRSFGLLSNGMGGIDWAGLNHVCDWLGVQDVYGLLWRMSVIRAHLKKRENEETNSTTPWHSQP